MGYIGQHLVSVVTGSPGGKSGARGYDLKHSDGSYGEIKTCYKVDQLGKCNDCGEGVSPDEQSCSTCGSDNIKRNDDSKWLISFRSDEDFANFAEPRDYFLVLFEFTDMNKRDEIQASIWSVDPKVPGFSLCMVDYYYNIRANSASKAPFNFWPYKLKFEIMRPVLIYRSLIKADDSIETLLFPGRNPPEVHLLSPLTTHKRARIAAGIWDKLAQAFQDAGAPLQKSSLEQIEAGRPQQVEAYDLFCDRIAVEIYREAVTPHLSKLPKSLSFVKDILADPKFA
jgi:hypothetical protein